MIRTFIAIELGEAVTSALLHEIELLRPHFPRINWVKPGNLHLTLKFLGNLPSENIPAIFEAATTAIAPLKAFTLDIAGISAFPDATNPRVLSAKCGAGTLETISLAKCIEDSLAPLGYPQEPRAYSPHLTLGRIKLPADAIGIDSFLPEFNTKLFGTIDVSEIVIFKSELKNQGARHTPMQRIPLQRQV